MSNKLADTFNEYGTPVTMFRCTSCGENFTVCPAVSDEELHHWDGCLAETCSSYDPGRDVDALFDAGVVHRRGKRSVIAPSSPEGLP